MVGRYCSCFLLHYSLLLHIANNTQIWFGVDTWNECGVEYGYKSYFSTTAFVSVEVLGILNKKFT